MEGTLGKGDLAEVLLDGGAGLVHGRLVGRCLRNRAAERASLRGGSERWEGEKKEEGDEGVVRVEEGGQVEVGGQGQQAREEGEGRRATRRGCLSSAAPTFLPSLAAAVASHLFISA